MAEKRQHLSAVPQNKRKKLMLKKSSHNESASENLTLPRTAVVKPETENTVPAEEIIICDSTDDESLKEASKSVEGWISLSSKKKLITQKANAMVEVDSDSDSTIPETDSSGRDSISSKLQKPLSKVSGTGSGSDSEFKTCDQTERTFRKGKKRKLKFGKMSVKSSMKTKKFFDHNRAIGMKTTSKEIQKSGKSCSSSRLSDASSDSESILQTQRPEYQNGLVSRNGASCSVQKYSDSEESDESSDSDSILSSQPAKIVKMNAAKVGAESDNDSSEQNKDFEPAKTAKTQFLKLAGKKSTLTSLANKVKAESRPSQDCAEQETALSSSQSSEGKSHFRTKNIVNSLMEKKGVLSRLLSKATKCTTAKIKGSEQGNKQNISLASTSTTSFRPTDQNRSLENLKNTKENNFHMEMSQFEKIKSISDSQETIVVLDEESTTLSSDCQPKPPKPYSFAQSTDSTIIYSPSGCGLIKQTSIMEQNSIVNCSIDSTDLPSPVLKFKGDGKWKTEESASPQVPFQDDHLRQSAQVLFQAPRLSLQSSTSGSTSEQSVPSSMPVLEKRVSYISDKGSYVESSPPLLSQNFLSSSDPSVNSSSPQDIKKLASSRQAQFSWAMKSQQKVEENNVIQGGNGVDEPMFSPFELSQNESHIPEYVRSALDMLTTEDSCVDEGSRNVDVKKRDKNRDVDLIINQDQKIKKEAKNNTSEDVNNPQESVGSVTVSVAVGSATVSSDSVASNIDSGNCYSEVDDVVYIFDSDDEDIFKTQSLPVSTHEPSSGFLDRESEPSEEIMWSDDEDAHFHAQVVSDNEYNAESDEDTLFEGFHEEDQISDDACSQSDSRIEMERVQMWDQPAQVEADSKTNKTYDYSDDYDLTEIDDVYEDDDDEAFFAASTQIDDCTAATKKANIKTEMQGRDEGEDNMKVVNSNLIFGKGGLDSSRQSSTQSQNFTCGNDILDSSYRNHAVSKRSGMYESRGAREEDDINEDRLFNQPTQRFDDGSFDDDNDALYDMMTQVDPAYESDDDILLAPTKRYAVFTGKEANDEPQAGASEGPERENRKTESDQSDEDSDASDLMFRMATLADDEPSVYTSEGTAVDDVCDRESVKVSPHADQTNANGDMKDNFPPNTDDNMNVFDMDTIIDSPTKEQLNENPFDVETQVDSVSDDVDPFLVNTQSDTIVGQPDAQDPYQMETLENTANEMEDASHPLGMETLKDTCVSQASSCQGTSKETPEEFPAKNVMNLYDMATQVDQDKKEAESRQKNVPCISDKPKLGTGSRPHNDRSLSLDQANVCAPETKERVLEKNAAVKRSASDDSIISTKHPSSSRNVFEKMEGISVNDATKLKDSDPGPSHRKSAVDTVHCQRLKTSTSKSSKDSRVPVKTSSSNSTSASSHKKNDKKTSAPKASNLTEGKFHSLAQQSRIDMETPTIVTDEKHHKSLPTSQTKRKDSKFAMATLPLAARKGSSDKNRNTKWLDKCSSKQASPAKKTSCGKNAPLDSIAAALRNFEQRNAVISISGAAKGWRESRFQSRPAMKTNDTNDDVEMPCTQDIMNQGLPLLTANLPISKKHFALGLPSQGRVASDQLLHDREMSESNTVSVTFAKPQTARKLNYGSWASASEPKTESSSHDAESNRYPSVLPAQLPGRDQITPVTPQNSRQSDNHTARAGTRETSQAEQSVSQHKGGILKENRTPRPRHDSRPTVHFRETANTIHPIVQRENRPNFFAPNTLQPLPVQKTEVLLDFLHIVLNWRSEWLKEQAKISSQLPPLFGENKNPENECSRSRMYYSDFNEYSEITLRLLSLEFWQMITRDWEKTRTRPRIKQYVQLVTQPKHSSPETKQRGLLNVIVTGVIGERERSSLPSEQDFLIIKVWGHSKMQKDTQKADWFKQFAYIKSVSVSSRAVAKDHPIFDQLPSMRNLSGKLLTFDMELGIRHRGVFLNTKLIKLKRISSLKTMLRQVHALNDVSQSPLCMQLLRPDRNEIFDHKICDICPYSSMNAEQARAVTNIRRAVVQSPEVRKVFLLQGPPGTGKTHAIVTLIQQIVECLQYKARICLATPSNAAVDEVAKRVLKLAHHLRKKGSKPISLVRVGDPKSVHLDVRNCTLDELVKTRAKENIPENVRAELKSINIEAGKLKESLSNRDQDRQQRVVIETRLTEQRAQIEKLEREMKCTPRRQYELECEVLDHAHVICGTLSSFGSKKLKSLLLRQNENAHRAHPFTCLIIDEATQAIEVDCLIPLQYKITKLILVGDQEQLPATVLSQVARDKGLDRSLFERVCLCFQAFQQDHSNWTPPILRLTRQYRMHDEILSLPNSLFYYKKLVTDESVLQRPRRIAPYLVFNVQQSRECKEGGYSRSVFNVDEAFCTAELCHQLVQKLGREVDSVYKKIGVICPYADQKQVILKYLEKRDRNLRSIEVNTVDGFQGQERDVIIISCVRAQENPTNIGFVADRKRMNVALTRAKQALYVIGNFKTLRTDKLWGELYEDARTRGLAVEVISTENFRNIARDKLA